MTIPPDPGTLLEYRLREAEGHITGLETKLAAVERRFETFKAEEIDRERKRLTWGISALGALVLTLAGVIWSYRAVIFRGTL